MFLLTSKKIVCVCDPIAENTSSTSALASRDHHVLLGTTYRILADALCDEPTCLAGIGEGKARSVVELSGSSSEDVDKVVTLGT